MFAILFQSPIGAEGDGNETTSSAEENTKSPRATKRRRRKENKHSQRESIDKWSKETEAPPSASSSTPTQTNVVIDPTPTSTYAHSVVPPITALALASACEMAPLIQRSHIDELYDFTSTLSFNTIPIELDRKIYNDNPKPEKYPYDHDLDFSRIRTPYDSTAFQLYLSKANIIDRYPDLPFKLANGFSLGPIPPISSSYTPDNSPFTYEHSDFIRKYIDEELSLGRFTGPFTKEELEKKIGPFRSSPIQVAIVDNGPDLPPKYRCCRNLSFKGSSDASINDLIGSENFHTRWYTAVECAKIIHHHNHYQAFIHVYMASTIIRRLC